MSFKIQTKIKNMKQIKLQMLGKGLTALCLMLWTHFAYAQPAVNLTFENLVQNSQQLSPLTCMQKM